METFSALLANCVGNSPVPGEFPAQRPVKRSFDVFFDLHRINGWGNNGEAGNLRRHRAHYDVTVMERNNPPKGQWPMERFMKDGSIATGWEFRFDFLQILNK